MSNIDNIDAFPLIPDDGNLIAPADQAAIAAAGLLDAADGPELMPVPPQPFGRTALFDFEKGEFVKAGGSPVFVSGLDAVEQWCLMAMHSARFAHKVFTPSFGMEEPDSIIGEAADLAEAVSDYGDRLSEALLVHDRITSVDDFQAHYDDSAGIMYIDGFTVVTDDDEQLQVNGIAVQIGAN